MRLKELVLPIDSKSPTRLVSQVVQGIIDLIQRGALVPGTPLPGRSMLAEHLKVSRNTVIAAYGELLVQGWIEIHERRGTFVADRSRRLASNAIDRKDLPQDRHQALDLPTRQDLATSQMYKIIKLSEGLPDYRLMPVDDMGKAYKTALLRKATEPFEYGSSKGQHEIRVAISEFLQGRRHFIVNPESILITYGNRMALNLVAQGLINSGDLVAVEDPGNPIVWEAFREVKARIVGIPVDDDGLDIDALENLLRRERLRLLYLTPRFQTPTTVELKAERRDRLIQLAKEHEFSLVEDDSEADYHFDGPYVPPLASIAEQVTVIYISSFSRLLAPGVRLGFLTGSQDVVDRLTTVRQRMDWHGDQVLELAIAELITKGSILKHIQHVGSIYQMRRDVTVAYLMDLFPSEIEVRIPDGGLSLWLQMDPSLDLDLWHKRCADEGIFFHPGRNFALDHRTVQGIRLGFAAFEPSEMAGILTRMRETMRAI